MNTITCPATEEGLNALFALLKQKHRHDGFIAGRAEGVEDGMKQGLQFALDTIDADGGPDNLSNDFQRGYDAALEAVHRTITARLAR